MVNHIAFKMNPAPAEPYKLRPGPKMKLYNCERRKIAASTLIKIPNIPLEMKKKNKIGTHVVTVNSATFPAGVMLASLFFTNDILEFVKQTKLIIKLLFHNQFKEHNITPQARPLGRRLQEFVGVLVMFADHRQTSQARRRTGRLLLLDLD